MSDAELHYAFLKKMYAKAPINRIYNPTMEISQGKATVSIEVSKKYHHSANGMHGSVYFKLLDDAAYFAVHSLEFEYFVYTSDFRVDLIRPFHSGTIHAIGEVVHAGRKDIVAKASLFCSNEKLLATGMGRFARSHQKLSDLMKD